MFQGIIIWCVIHFTGNGIIAHGILPPQCHGILMNGSTSPYGVTSIAGTFQRFCSQRRYISQCMIDNEDQMMASDNPISWAIGLVFEKNVFDSKSGKICKRLAGVASELECILSETDMSCGSGFSESIPNTYSLYKNNNITDGTARSLICKTIISTAYCYKTGLKPCIEPVKEFMAAYNLVFSGYCTRVSVLDNLYKSAMFSCVIESFPNIITSVTETETESTTPELDRQNVSSATDILRVYANHVLHLCTNAEKFTECVHETVPMSNNAMDRIVRELIDFSRKENVVKIIANICSGILDDIQSNLHCIISEEKTSKIIPVFANCFNTGNYAFLSELEDSILSADINGDAVRSTFCKPIEEMVTCVTDNISSCNSTVSSLVNKLMKDILRSDCKEKRHVKNSALNHRRDNVWTTVMLTMMLLFTEMHPV